MARFPGVRQRLIAHVYGDGFAAMVAAGVTDRAITHLRAAVRKEPEVLDISKLVPGESYVVSTRPAPTRKERKLERAALETRRKLERASRPSRSTRRLERKLVKSVRTAEKAEVGSGRWAKATVQVQRQEQQLARRLEPSKQARQLQARSSTIESEIERRRATALLKSRKKARPPRRRVYR